MVYSIIRLLVCTSGYTSGRVCLSACLVEVCRFVYLSVCLSVSLCTLVCVCVLLCLSIHKIYSRNTTSTYHSNVIKGCTFVMDNTCTLIKNKDGEVECPSKSQHFISSRSESEGNLNFFMRMLFLFFYRYMTCLLLAARCHNAKKHRGNIDTDIRFI